MLLLLTAVVALAAGCWLRGGRRADPFSFEIDATLPVSDPSCVAAAGADGVPFEYVADQLVVRPPSRAALDQFLVRYRGKILVDGDAPHVVDGIQTPGSGWYLVEVDPMASPLDELSAPGRTALAGHARFSSEGAARLAALVVRERTAFEIGVNLNLRDDGYERLASVLEHPNGSGGYLDFKAQPYMQLARIIDAWDYLAYQGIPFGPRPWRRPTIAIIDGGFAVDGKVAIGGNPDLDMARISQLNGMVSYSDARRFDASGPNPSSCSGGSPCPYHGTQVFSVAAAVPHNRFGAAGTAGVLPRAVLIRSSADAFHVSEAIADAGRMRVDVINVSMGQTCSDLCNEIASNTFTNFQTSVTFARGYALATVVVAAGNDTNLNHTRYGNVPCTLDGVLCVGETDWAGAAEPWSGRGPRVGLWAPGCIDVTPVPNAAGVLASATSQFCGTSAAAPFVSGVVALLKALDPALHPDDVAALLRSTARPSSDPVVSPGVVDALAAVQALRPNQPPTITITSHATGQAVTRNQRQNFIATIADPELDVGDVSGMRVRWMSDRQGLLCLSNNCDAALLALGVHHVTATVFDGWGAQATATVELTVVAGRIPTPTITWPASGATFAASQQIELRGVASGASEPVIPGNRLAWASDLAGPLGTGTRLSVVLPAGDHVITLRATDQSGQVGTTSIQLHVTAEVGVPTARILAPADDSSVPVNAPFQLLGRGIDPIEGELPDAALTWLRGDGTVLGSGRALTVSLPGPHCGPVPERITLRVRNSAGRTAETSILVNIGPVC